MHSTAKIPDLGKFNFSTKNKFFQNKPILKKDVYSRNFDLLVAFYGKFLVVNFSPKSESCNFPNSPKDVKTRMLREKNFLSII